MKRMSLSLCVGAVACVLVLQFPTTAVAKGPEKVLYAFGSKPDGRAPSSMIDVNGTFYGTTSFGGTGCKGFGCGTVFEVDPATDTETVLYSFCGKSQKKICTDGDVPGGMIKLNGKLFGETELGGAYQAGTVFAFDLKTRKEEIVHSFCAQDCADGSYPDGGLTAVKGTLYGTTPFGGAYEKGTIFSLDPGTGAETVLYSFCSLQNCTDGDLPSGGLIDVNGTLYGTTGRGGANCPNSMECGTLFALDLNTGIETTLYSFCSQPNCADGNEPASGLVDLGGMLYGATVLGGAYHNAGTVFALDPKSGGEAVVYSFCQTLKTVCKDGASPGGLTAVNGKLYGTASGGNAVVVCQGGCGTVFEVDPATGAEAVLYAFCSQKVCGDGTLPRGLFHVNGTLYGTTSEGGHYDGHRCDFGCGTVFALMH
jgi:uncharacterized repeat protein (TIGR03803 family)